LLALGVHVQSPAFVDPAGEVLPLGHCVLLPLPVQ
jgi:hypothetical protein